MNSKDPKNKQFVGNSRVDQKVVTQVLGRSQTELTKKLTPGAEFTLAGFRRKVLSDPVIIVIEGTQERVTIISIETHHPTDNGGGYKIKGMISLISLDYLGEKGKITFH